MLFNLKKNNNKIYEQNLNYTVEVLRTFFLQC